MIPFHKIYSAIFKSFNINSETETIGRLKSEWAKKVMIIKRSWIFWLAMIWVPFLILILWFLNIYISYFSYKDINLKYSLLIGVIFSLFLFIFSVWSYLAHFRAVYNVPKVENDMDKIMKSLEEGDKYFIRFFNQTILNQWILLWLLIWSVVFYFTHMKINWGIWILADGFLLFTQWILLGKYRKKMIDLEMDYNIVVPWKIIFVNQSDALIEPGSRRRKSEDRHRKISFLDIKFFPVWNRGNHDRMRWVKSLNDEHVLRPSPHWDSPIYPNHAPQRWWFPRWEYI